MAFEGFAMLIGFGMAIALAGVGVLLLAWFLIAASSDAAAFSAYLF